MHSRRFSLLLFPFAAGVAVAQFESVPVEVLVAEIAAGHPEIRFYEAEIAAARAGVRGVAPAAP